MAILVKSASMESAVLVMRTWKGGRSFEDLIFRVGLATRKDYIVSHK